MTFEEIRDKLAEQEFPLLADADMFQVERRTFCLALDMIRPLLDGWKDADEELPDYYNPVIGLYGTIQIPVWRANDGEEDIWTKNGSDLILDEPTFWRYDPPLPGDFSQLEALLTDQP